MADGEQTVLRQALTALADAASHEEPTTTVFLTVATVAVRAVAVDTSSFATIADWFQDLDDFARAQLGFIRTTLAPTRNWRSNSPMMLQVVFNSR